MPVNERNTPSDKESESTPVDHHDRPKEWERISFDDLPEPDYNKYPIPDPAELTEASVPDS